jgi:hypothetical protein
MNDESPLTMLSFSASTENMTLALGPTVKGSPDDPAYDVWIDELAVDNRPIGCAR